MKKNIKNYIISSILILSSILFTIMVKIIDVKNIGPNNSSIGFSTINNYFFNLCGVNFLWYNITDWLGIIPIIIAIIYAVIGLCQIIKRKSILKVDRELIVLGVFYIILLFIYIFFEKIMINYRPILINGILEASYPSSHTLMTLCICGSSIILNKKLYNNKITKFVNIISYIIIFFTIFGRIISGVHWITDIIGGLIISASYLMLFYSIIKNINNVKNKIIHFI